MTGRTIAKKKWTNTCAQIRSWPSVYWKLGIVTIVHRGLMQWKLKYRMQNLATQQKQQPDNSWVAYVRLFHISVTCHVVSMQCFFVARNGKGQSNVDMTCIFSLKITVAMLLISWYWLDGWLETDSLWRRILDPLKGLRILYHNLQIVYSNGSSRITGSLPVYIFFYYHFGTGDSC